MQNPFSTTFSKIPEYTYISTIGAKDIIENFSYDNPTEAVYKITGLRGSGKTVIMSSVLSELRSDENREKGWCVYSINPTRDMLNQLATQLFNEDFIKKESKLKSENISANVLGTGAGFGFSNESGDGYTDVGVSISNMLNVAMEKNKKILICVDEVSKTTPMIEFALEFAGWLIAGLPVYFVCAGLYENVLEVGNVKNLTFFRRGRTVSTVPLNAIKMSEIYKTKLGVDVDVAKEMASITKGYAYAFQELGSLYFNKGKNENLADVVEKLKAELFSYSYEKIWEELSEEDRALAGLLVDKEEYKRAEILSAMGEKSKNYSVYRDRLLKRGVITARQGYISLNPPFLAEYIKEYGG